MEELVIENNPLLFNDSAVDLTTGALDKPHKSKMRENMRNIVDARRAATAKEALAEFERGYELFGFTKGQFSCVDLIEAAMDITGPAHLIVSTWTAANKDMSQVQEFLQSGKLLSTQWLVDFTFQRRYPALAQRLRDLFGHDCVRVAQTHAKFTVIYNETWDIVIRTSMNLNTNPRFEDFTIAHDPKLATFLRGIMDEIWKKQNTGLQLESPGTIRRHFSDEL